MDSSLRAAAVTFDFGQTLGDLDTALLAARLAERAIAAEAAALDAAQPAAWRAYDAAIRAGEAGHPWRRFMRELLAAAQAQGGRAALEQAVEWLWTEQPRRNLWRRPVPGMLELVRALRAAGVPLAIVSNSEGRVAELAEEMGIRSAFDVVADSGLIGVEKPDPAIFHWAASRLGVEPARIVHVGDSMAADVRGALGAGFGAAIWFRGDAAAASDERITCAADAFGVASALRALGVPALAP